MHKQRTKVCFVSSTLSNGGAERALSNLLCNMSIEEYEITVLLLNGIVTYPIPDDVKIVDLKKRSPFHIPLCFTLLLFYLLKIKPQIVISVWSFPSLLTGIALFIGRIKTKWIPRIANNPADEEFGWKKSVFNFLYKRAAGFIVLCDELKINFLSHYPFAEGKTHMIRNGFNQAELEEKSIQESDTIQLPESPYMVSVGSLTQQKRHDVLIKAYAELDANSQLPLLILGGGPLLESLQLLCKELGLEDKIQFKGFVTNPYPYVKNASLFVLASDFEGLCNAAIEAQMLGVPAVITACPTGNREIVIEGKTGYLVPVNQPVKLAQGIEMALSSPEINGLLREQSKDLVGQNYRIERSASDMQQLLEDYS